MESGGWEMMPSIAEAYNAAESFGDRVVGLAPVCATAFARLKDEIGIGQGGGGVASESGTKNGSGVV
ncbi:hypothetical protein CGMCC3_g3136 [Colletotrichum fructicola]|nr:uncharacterized protein CGMCC3_g3136 [Colletotrichum fructicola]KAE9580780.1 hypothetical protein CGMCC3_g3136 [Colletotrichum fructicola]